MSTKSKRLEEEEEGERSSGRRRGGSRRARTRVDYAALNRQGTTLAAGAAATTTNASAPDGDGPNADAAVTAFSATEKGKGRGERRGRVEDSPPLSTQEQKQKEEEEEGDEEEMNLEKRLEMLVQEDSIDRFFDLDEEPAVEEQEDQDEEEEAAIKTSISNGGAKKTSGQSSGPRARNSRDTFVKSKTPMPPTPANAQESSASSSIREANGSTNAGVSAKAKRPTAREREREKSKSRTPLFRGGDDGEENGDEEGNDNEEEEAEEEGLVEEVLNGASCLPSQSETVAIAKSPRIVAVQTEAQEDEQIPAAQMGALEALVKKTTGGKGRLSALVMEKLKGRQDQPDEALLMTNISSRARSRLGLASGKGNGTKTTALSNGHNGTDLPPDATLVVGEASAVRDLVQANGAEAADLMMELPTEASAGHGENLVAAVLPEVELEKTISVGGMQELPKLSEASRLYLDEENRIRRGKRASKDSGSRTKVVIASNGADSTSRKHNGEGAGGEGEENEEGGEEEEEVVQRERFRDVAFDEGEEDVFMDEEVAANAARKRKEKEAAKNARRKKRRREEEEEKRRESLSRAAEGRRTDASGEEEEERDTDEQEQGSQPEEAAVKDAGENHVEAGLNGRPTESEEEEEEEEEEADEEEQDEEVEGQIPAIEQSERAKGKQRAQDREPEPPSAQPQSSLHPPRASLTEPAPLLDYSMAEDDFETDEEAAARLKEAKRKTQERRRERKERAGLDGFPWIGVEVPIASTSSAAAQSALLDEVDNYILANRRIKRSSVEEDPTYSPNGGNDSDDSRSRKRQRRKSANSSSSAHRSSQQQQGSQGGRLRHLQPNATFYATGGNRFGRNKWSEEETQCLHQSLAQLVKKRIKDPTFQVYAEVLKRHGVHGTKSKTLHLRNNVQIKDKARNELLRMQKVGERLPGWSDFLFPTLFEEGRGGGGRGTPSQTALRGGARHNLPRGHHHSSSTSGRRLKGESSDELEENEDDEEEDEEISDAESSGSREHRISTRSKGRPASVESSSSSSSDESDSE